MSAKQLIETASKKGISITRYKAGIYQYSYNGYEWTNVVCSFNEFAKLIKSL